MHGWGLEHSGWAPTSVFGEAPFISLDELLT